AGRTRELHPPGDRLRPAGRVAGRGGLTTARNREGAQAAWRSGARRLFSSSAARSCASRRWHWRRRAQHRAACWTFPSGRPIAVSATMVASYGTKGGDGWWRDWRKGPLSPPRPERLVIVARVRVRLRNGERPGQATT